VVEEQHERQLTRSHILSKETRKHTKATIGSFCYDCFVASIVHVNIAIVVTIMIQIVKESKFFTQIELVRLYPMEVSRINDRLHTIETETIVFDNFFAADAPS